jgi:hypothetical protein
MSEATLRRTPVDDPGNEPLEVIRTQLQVVPTPLEAVGSGTSEATLRSSPVDNPGTEPLEAIRAQLQAVQTQLEALGQRTRGVLDVAGLEALEREASGLSGQLSDLLVAVQVQVALSAIPGLFGKISNKNKHLVQNVS